MINIYEYFITILKLIKEKNLLSIFGIRILFIYSSIIYNGYGYIDGIKNSDDYKCNINLNLEENEINFYLQHICLLGLSLLNETFNSKELYDKIVKESDELVNDNYNEFKEKYLNELNQIEIELNDYYYLRDKDGWHDSNEQIKIINLWNKINLDDDTLWEKVNLTKWTPIANQKMVGGNWGKLKGIIDKNIIDKIENLIKLEYNKINLADEHNQILETSINYSNDLIAQAEFWLEIDDNFTIAGFYNYILINYFQNNPNDIFLQIKLFHILNISIFQTSIIVWKIKYDLQDPRPIQIIRGSQISLPIKYYFGESNTNYWLPFKNYENYLPSYPDYPSDLSAISSTASFIISKFLSENIADLNIIIDKEFESIYSDNESNIDNNDLNNKFNLELIKIQKKSSKIIKNIPDNDIIIKNNTWNDLALNIGNSGFTSGLSTNFSNTNGHKIGIEIGKVIYDYFYNP